jgi:hypothetical protein
LNYLSFIGYNEAGTLPASLVSGPEGTEIEASEKRCSDQAAAQPEGTSKVPGLPAALLFQAMAAWPFGDGYETPVFQISSLSVSWLDFPQDCVRIHQHGTRRPVVPSLARLFFSI